MTEDYYKTLKEFIKSKIDNEYKLEVVTFNYIEGKREDNLSSAIYLFKTDKDYYSIIIKCTIGDKLADVTPNSKKLPISFLSIPYWLDLMYWLGSMTNEKGLCK